MSCPEEEGVKCCFPSVCLSNRRVTNTRMETRKKFKFVTQFRWISHDKFKQSIAVISGTIGLRLYQATTKFRQEMCHNRNRMAVAYHSHAWCCPQEVRHTENLNGYKAKRSRSQSRTIMSARDIAIAKAPSPSLCWWHSTFLLFLSLWLRFYHYSPT